MMVEIRETAMLLQRRRSTASNTVAPFGHFILVSGYQECKASAWSLPCLTLLALLVGTMSTWRLIQFLCGWIGRRRREVHVVVGILEGMRE